MAVTVAFAVAVIATTRSNSVAVGLADRATAIAHHATVRTAETSSIQIICGFSDAVVADVDVCSVADSFGLQWQTIDNI